MYSPFRNCISRAQLQPVAGCRSSWFRWICSQSEYSALPRDGYCTYEGRIGRKDKALGTGGKLPGVQISQGRAPRDTGALRKGFGQGGCWESTSWLLMPSNDATKWTQLVAFNLKSFWDNYVYVHYFRITRNGLDISRFLVSLNYCTITYCNLLNINIDHKYLDFQ